MAAPAWPTILPSAPAGAGGLLAFFGAGAFRFGARAFLAAFAGAVAAGCSSSK